MEPGDTYETRERFDDIEEAGVALIAAWDAIPDFHPAEDGPRKRWYEEMLDALKRAYGHEHASENSYGEYKDGFKDGISRGNGSSKQCSYGDRIW